MDLADITPHPPAKQAQLNKLNLHPKISPNPLQSPFPPFDGQSIKWTPRPCHKTATKRKSAFPDSCTSAIGFCWTGNCVATCTIACVGGEKSVEYRRVGYDRGVYCCGRDIPSCVFGGHVFKVGCEMVH